MASRISKNIVFVLLVCTVLFPTQVQAEQVLTKVFIGLFWDELCDDIEINREHYFKVWIDEHYHNNREQYIECPSPFGDPCIAHIEFEQQVDYESGTIPIVIEHWERDGASDADDDQCEIISGVQDLSLTLNLTSCQISGTGWGECGTEIEVGSWPVLFTFQVTTEGLPPAWPPTGILKEWGIEGFRAHDIEVAEDGTAWALSDRSGNAELRAFVPLHHTPPINAGPFSPDDAAHFRKIARDLDGRMWITDQLGDRLYRFDPATGDFVDSVDLPEDFGSNPDPFGVAVAPDGKVWFACWDSYSIGYYDPAPGVPDDQRWGVFELSGKPCGTEGVKDPGNPVDIAVDGSGIVWFTFNGYGSRDPGLGYLDLTSGMDEPYLFICENDLDSVDLGDPHGIVIDPVATNKVWFVDQRTDNPGQVVTKSLLSGFTAYPFPVPPEGLVNWDAHYLAVDPPLTWATSFSNDALLIMEETPDSTSPFRFTSLHLPYLAGPMGICISEDEVWFGGTRIRPETGAGTGVGRFTIMPDSDADGISDEMDAHPYYSNNFVYPTTTATLINGEILERGGQDISVIRHISHDDLVGVIAIADCSGVDEPQAEIESWRYCDGTPQDCITNPTDCPAILTGCDKAQLGCGSPPYLKALVGPIELMLPDGIVVTVPTGAKVSFEEILVGAINIQNSGEQGTISIEYQGEVTTLNVGQSTIITDKEPPVANCQNVTVSTDPGVCTANVSVDHSSFDPNEPPIPITLEQQPPPPYNLGETQVELTVTNSLGLYDTCTATVSVQDTTRPVTNCPADTTVECDEPTDPSSTGMAMATDACDSAPNISFSDAETPGTCPQEKTITRTWTATDASNNSNSCVQTINVVDTTPPDISCNAPSTIIPPDAPISFTATATDNCDDSPSVEITEFDCFKYTEKGGRIDKTESCVVDVVGDTITIIDSGGVGANITWTVRSTDSCGNIEEKECKVEVINPSQ